MKLAIIRNGRVAARVDGALPSIEDLDGSVAVGDVHRLTDGLAAAFVSSGEPPDGFSWVHPAYVQRVLSTEDSDALGKAMLCA